MKRVFALIVRRQRERALPYDSYAKTLLEAYAGV